MSFSEPDCFSQPDFSFESAHTESLSSGLRLSSALCSLVTASLSLLFSALLCEVFSSHTAGQVRHQTRSHHRSSWNTYRSTLTQK